MALPWSNYIARTTIVLPDKGIFSKKAWSFGKISISFDYLFIILSLSNPDLLLKKKNSNTY